jgi:hypothetical protein
LSKTTRLIKVLLAAQPQTSTKRSVNFRSAVSCYSLLPSSEKQLFFIRLINFKSNTESFSAFRPISLVQLLLLLLPPGISQPSARPCIIVPP